MVHEYGHILDYLISIGIDTRKYIISSLANDTKINTINLIKNC